MASKEKKAPLPEQGGMNTGVAIVGFLLSFFAGSLLMYGYDRRAGGTGEIAADTSGGGAAWSDEAAPVPISSKDPMWGSREAPVTLVVFSDFECPFCSRVNPTIEQVQKTYTDKKVRIVWKNSPLPFHKNAKPAAEAAAGVMALKGSDAFWKFHKAAFANQQSLNQESFEKWAKDAGVDAAAFKAGLAGHKWADKVEKDLAVSKSVGVNGTPATMINGILVSGAQPFEKFKAVIDQELEKADKKTKAGVAKDKLYVELTKDNFKNAPKEEEEEEKEDTKSVFKIPVGTAPVLGNPNALVTIIEYSDFQCPYCKKTEDTLKQVRDTYGDKVRLVWKDETLPFHPRAIPAATLAREARSQKGDKGFWDAHDKLFGTQPKLEDGDLEAVAKDLGLNIDKWKANAKAEKWNDDIDVDNDQAAAFEANGTPHFFINGRRLVGAQPFEKFKAIIDEEVTKAQGLLAKGTKPEKLYEELIKDGKGPKEEPAPEKKEVKGIPAGSPFKGAANAKVVIHEYSDFQCPFCSRVEPTIEKVLKKYGDRVKLVWHDKPLPMHPDAPLASEAAREAFKQKGADAFWKMHDVMFKNQQKLKREDLDGYAKDLGLDMDKFKTALDSRAHKATIDAESKAGDDMQISGTPAFLINGYFISGAQPYGKFKQAIELALKEAK